MFSLQAQAANDEMGVCRTYETDVVRLIVGEVFDYITDDSVTNFEDYSPRFDDDSRWYLARDGEDVVGAFWMRRINGVTWEAHANVRPSRWGDRRGTEFCQEAIDEMIRDTGAKKVIALIPDCAPHVQRMAEAIGFEREGVQTQSFLKNGKLYDQIYYGMSRT